MLLETLDRTKSPSKARNKGRKNEIRSHGINNIMCIHNSSNNVRLATDSTAHWHKHTGSTAAATYSVGR